MAYLPGQQYVQNAAGAWIPVGYASTALPAPQAVRDVNTSRNTLVSTFQALNAVPLIGLVNSTFFATTSITDNYTTAHTGSATSSVTLNDGFALLSTGTTNPSTAQLNSKDFATYNGIGELMFLNGLRAPQAGVAGVIKRWGAYDSANGYFFEDNAGTFRVVSRKNSVDTAVASGSFNGLLGTTYTLDQNSHFFQILMTGGRAIFMIDQVLLHTISVPAAATTTSGSLNLGIRVEIVSTQTVNQTLELRGQNIGRLGVIDSKRLNESLLDASDAELVRSVSTASTGAANTYVNQTATVTGTKNALDVNLAASAGGAAAVSQAVSTTATAAATGTASTTAMAVAAVGNAGNATITLLGGTYTALTLAFEACPEVTGTYWFPIDAARTEGSGIDIQPSFTVAGVRAWNVIAPGYQYIRARVSAITQTVAPTLLITQGPFLYDPSPTVAPIDGQKFTYAAAADAVTVTVSGDVFVLSGSATRTVRVTRVAIQSTATAAAVLRATLSKRIGTYSGGTSTTPATYSFDSASSAGTAVFRSYTASPTAPGTALTLRAFRINQAVATGSAPSSEFLFGNRPGQAVVLRGTSEHLALAFATSPGAGSTFSVDVEWTEE